MGGRRVWVVALLVLLPGSAAAHSHKAGGRAGIVLAKGSRLWGGYLSGEWMLPRHEGDRVRTGRYSVFADLSVSSGAHDDGNRTQAALIGGLRVTSMKPRHGFQPFAHVQLAGVRTSDTAPDRAEWAWGPGVGVGCAYELHELLAATVQADYVWLLWDDSIAHRFQRISIGLEFRFPRHASK